jgi:glutathione reductase (NADPH)
MAHDVDLFVIGAGSGGVRAARIAAGHGARVMVAEESRIGGTCVIRGCVPKKLMVYASRFADEFADAPAYGWTLGKASFEWATLRDNLEREVTRLSGLYRAGLNNARVEIVEERASLENANAVRLSSGRIVTARHILVATGGRPSLDPAIPGHEFAIVSDQVFGLHKQPKTLVVVGGGYIALEFASVFARLGTKVSLVHRGDNILRGFDPDIRTRLRDALKHAGITLHLERTIASIVPDRADRRIVTVSGGEIVTADAVLLATGRHPNTKGLGLEPLGVALDARGAIKVDAASQSTVPSIHAVGDVTDRLNLTPVAIREGHAFADSVFGTRKWTADHALVPTAVFTTPEIGTVGLAEDAALALGHRLRVFETAFRPMKVTLSGREERVYMKLIIDAPSDKVLGLHILGEHGAEIIQAAAIAIKMGATKADFDATMALHPSAAEELVTMRTPRA